MVFTCVFTCFSCCMWSESSKSSLRQRTAGLSRQQSPVFHHRRQRPGGPWRPVAASRSFCSFQWQVSLGGWTGMGLDQELHKIRVSRDVPGHGKVNVQVTQSHSESLIDVIWCSLFGALFDIAGRAAVKSVEPRKGFVQFGTFSGALPQPGPMEGLRHWEGAKQDLNSLNISKYSIIF